MTKKELNKLNKNQVISLLAYNAREIQTANKELFDKMAYADKQLRKDAKSVTRLDLLTLAREMLDTLGDKLLLPGFKPVAENSAKPVLKSKTEDKPEEKKKAQPKTDMKKEVQEVLKSKDSNVLSTAIPLATADCFPAEFKSEEDTYELAHDIKSMKDLYDCMQKDEEILFAYYWSKRLLKQFPYFNGYIKQPTEFENDLDLASPLHISEDLVVAYQISVYTEAIYTILPVDFSEVDGVRCAGGIEYQIYRKKQ